MVDIYVSYPGASAREVAAVGITNQRETALVWERETGQPVGPCVVWQCRRSAPFCNQLKVQGHEPFLRERTGLQVDPMFSGSKMRWLLDEIDDGAGRAVQVAPGEPEGCRLL